MGGRQLIRFAFGRRLLWLCGFHAGCRSIQQSQIDTNNQCIQACPRGTPMQSAQGVRSTTEGEIFKGTDGACADPGTQNFPCHGGGAAGGQGHSQFYSIDFHVTHRFFVTFFTEESNVSLVPRLLSFIRKWGRRQVPRPQSNQSRNSSRSVTPNSLAMARRSSSVMVCSTGLPLASTSM